MTFDNYNTSAYKNSQTQRLYNKCWKIYCAMKLLGDPLVDTFVDLDYYRFRSHIALACKNKFRHPLFDKILKYAGKS